jgi:ABC-type glycerol-3-phosphate transport system permease component
MTRDNVAHYFVRRGWSHLLLLTAAMIFLFPFVWMVATSIKTDEEIAAGDWWPTIPRFRDHSPYVRPAVRIERPTGVSDQLWNLNLALLQSMAELAIDERVVMRRDLSPDDRTALRAAATPVLLSRLIGRLNIELWQSDATKLLQAFRRLLTAEAVESALEDRLASVELLELQVRTLDARIFNVCTGDAIAREWRVESGDARVVADGPNASRLEYHFVTPDSPPIVLRYEFDFPADPAALQRLSLSLRADDSWHRLDATLDLAGQRWVSTRTTYLAQHRAMSAMFQPPTFNDDTFQPKIWVPLRREGLETPNSNRYATLRITISPTSTAGAIWGKVARSYTRAFHAVPFWRYVGNSVTLVLLTTLGTLFSSAFVAYAFARLHWPGRSIAFVLLLATMMLPAQVTMIPSFVIWRALGWYNTLNPLWVPAFLGGAFFVFLMTQQMKTIPRELEEAARLDGLNAVQTWYYIILPQVRPTAAAIAIMTFMGAWNEFMGPLIYLRDQARFPLSLGLFTAYLESFNDLSLIMAANTLMTLPVIVIFFLCQRYFIQGITMSGLKG